MMGKGQKDPYWMPHLHHPIGGWWKKGLGPTEPLQGMESHSSTSHFLWPWDASPDLATGQAEGAS